MLVFFAYAETPSSFDEAQMLYQQTKSFIIYNKFIIFYEWEDM